MSNNTEDFTGQIVSVVIAVIVVQAVQVPIISGTVTEDMDPTLKTILTIIPVFLGLSIIMMVVKMFLDNRKGF